LKKEVRRVILPTETKWVKPQIISRALLRICNRVWYFRCWSLLWAIAAVMTFAGLIVYSQRASVANNQSNWRLWVENTAQLAFPLFRLSTLSDESTNKILMPFCSWNGNQQLIAPCAHWPDLTKCIEIVPDAYASPKFNSLTCYMNITSPPNADTAIGFEIPMNLSTLPTPRYFVKPDNNAWIFLNKINIRPRNGKSLDFYDRRIVYESTTFSTNVFIFTLTFDNFFIFHYIEDDWYTGMMAVADMGGLAFFLYIIHAMSMAVVGVFLDNNSVFLHGGEIKSYNNI